jgi:hypothetical protein
MITNESVTAGESMTPIRIVFDPMINLRIRPELHACVREWIAEAGKIGSRVGDYTLCLDGCDYRVAYRLDDDGTGAHVMVSMDPALVR